MRAYAAAPMTRRSTAVLVVVAAFFFSARPLTPSAQGSAPFDVLIRGGRVVDGTGAPWFVADIGVTSGRIAAIGVLKDRPAARTIDASGLIVAPGFIDMMGQTAEPFIQHPEAAFNLLTQGITTLNAGEGGSDAPLDDVTARASGWKTMREYFAKLEQTGMPMNMAQTVGHTQVRSLVVGETDRKATPDEMTRMKDLVREAMEAGAIGVSTSLIYPPAVYAPEQEIADLAKVAGEYGGRYFTHMRNEGDRLLEAIDEALRIGEAAGTPVHIFHLKTAGRGNWGKMDLALARIRAARRAGQQVGADIYPYINNGLGIRALIHPRHSAAGPEDLLRQLGDPAARAAIRKEMEQESGWENWYAHVGKDWDRIVLGTIEDPSYASQNGKTVASIARETGKDPWDVFFEIAARNANAMPESMSEANKIKVMREPFVSFDTDAGPTIPGEGSHPRTYGAFPRVLARYVRDLGALSLEDAVHRMSAVAANEIMAYDRGRLAPGLAADIVVFDADRIQDRATFAHPDQASEGMRFVLVNGQVVLENGAQTGAKPGRILRGPGWKQR